jgi:GT2 family glycosyltransferase
MQRQLFESLGGFDERFPYAAMEDVDLRLRLTKYGHKFLFIKLASVCHPWRHKGGWKKLKQHQQSTLIYLSIHPEQVSNINSKYYLKIALYGILKSTIPEILKLNLFGIHEAFLEHFSFLQMAIVLLKYKRLNHR